MEPRKLTTSENENALNNIESKPVQAEIKRESGCYYQDIMDANIALLKGLGYTPYIYFPLQDQSYLGESQPVTGFEGIQPKLANKAYSMRLFVKEGKFYLFSLRQLMTEKATLSPATFSLNDSYMFALVRLNTTEGERLELRISKGAHPVLVNCSDAQCLVPSAADLPGVVAAGEIMAAAIKRSDKILDAKALESEVPEETLIVHINNKTGRLNQAVTNNKMMEIQSALITKLLKAICMPNGFIPKDSAQKHSLFVNYDATHPKRDEILEENKRSLLKLISDLNAKCTPVAPQQEIKLSTRNFLEDMISPAEESPRKPNLPFLLNNMFSENYKADFESKTEKGVDEKPFPQIPSQSIK